MGSPNGAAEELVTKGFTFDNVYLMIYSMLSLLTKFGFVVLDIVIFLCK